MDVEAISKSLSLTAVLFWGFMGFFKALCNIFFQCLLDAPVGPNGGALLMNPGGGAGQAGAMFMVDKPHSNIQPEPSSSRTTGIDRQGVVNQPTAVESRKADTGPIARVDNNTAVENAMAQDTLNTHASFQPYAGDLPDRLEHA